MKSVIAITIFLFLVTFKPDSATGQESVIVRLDDDADASLVAMFEGSADKKEAARWSDAFQGIRSVEPVLDAQAGALKRVHPLQRAYVMHLTKTADPDSVLVGWRRVPGVRYVQRNHRYRLDAVSTDEYNDPSLDSLNHLPVVRAPEAWEVTTGQAHVRVGVVDTGLYLDHPDLTNQVWINAAEDINGNGRFDAGDRNRIDDDGNGYVDDVVGYDFVDRPAMVEQGDYFDRDPDPSEDNRNQGGRGHGTIVAGALGAELDNGEGGSGIAPGIRLVPLRAFGADGRGEDDDIAAAIIYAAIEGLDVLNLSFGDVYESSLMREAISYAVSQGTVVVASGGNLGGDAPHYPSDYPDVVGVAWLTADGNSIAGRAAHGLGIDLGAPGTAIYTTTLPPEEGSDSAAAAALYGRRSGSSMAAPLVAGAAALLKSIDANLTPEAIRAILTHTAVDIDAPEWDHRTGGGLLDVAAAVQRALPARVSLSLPAHNAAVSASQVAIVGTAMHPRFVSYTVDVHAGDDDPRGQWQPVAGPVGVQALRDTLTVWSLEDVPDGTYTVRLAVQLNDGRSIEDRRRIFVDRSAPEVVIQLRDRALVDGQWGIAIDAEADDLTTMHMTVASQRGVETVVSDRKARRHGLVWSDAAGYGGALHVALRATNPAGLATTLDTALTLPAYRPRPQLFDVQQLDVSHGYLLPRTTDLDQDRLPELVYNQYDEGWVGDTLVVAEWDGQSFRRVQQLVANVIPRDVGDSDGDGLEELLTQVAGATLLFEQGGPASFLESVAYIDTTGLANPFDSLAAFGARLTDLDADGRGELLVHNTRQWRLLEYDGMTYTEVARLTNPTGVQDSELSANEFSTPQVLVGDVDGDGRPDLIAGDTDGDWIWYEARANDVLKPVWTFETTRYNASARMTTGDFDGDGIAEFVTHTQPWTQPTSSNEREPDFGAYYVWNSPSDDEAVLEARWIVPGQTARHGALAALDVNGDGRDELAIAHPPHLYLMQRTLEGAWKIAFHRKNLSADPVSGVRSAALTVTDFDGDGREELIAGAGDGHFYRLVPAGPAFDAPPPPRWTRAVSLNASTVSLSWEALGADSVTVYARLSSVDPFDPLRTSSSAVLEVPTAETRDYALAGWHEGAMTMLSDVRRVRPHAASTVRQVRYPASGTVEVLFSEPLQSDLRADQFRVRDGAHPREVLLGREGHSLTLRFNDARSGPDTLSWQDLHDREGMPVAEHSVGLQWPEIAAATLIVEEWTVDADGTIRLTFNAPLDADVASMPAHYRLDPSGQIDEVRWDTTRPREVQVLTSGRALGATGLDTYLVVDNLRSSDGQRMPGDGQSLALTRPAVSLEDVYVFPNPLDSRLHTARLMVAGVPRAATVRIYSAQGIFVRQLEERNGNGGIPWDLRDGDGNPIASGIYLVRVEAEGESPVLLKAAIVR